MKINPSTFRIPLNYVLILPDENYETIQSAGKETGIVLPDFKYEKDKEGGNVRVSVKERNFSVYGTVYAIPERIGFFRKEIRKLTGTYNIAGKIGDQTIILNRSVMEEVGRLTDKSCLFETECEVEIGDRVKFSYMAHKSAKEKKIAVDTPIGEMYLVKYDMLTMVVDEKFAPKRLLNGYIMVEPEEDDSIKTDEAMNYTVSPTGLILPTFKHKMKRNRKNQIGTVRYVGKKVNGYLQNENQVDPDLDIQVGDRIIYDPRGASRHEHMYHQMFSDKPMQLIQRRDVWIQDDESGIFDTISIHRKGK